MQVLYVIQYFDNDDWIIKDVKAGDPSDKEIARIASQGYFDAVQWDINRPVRLLVVYRDDDDTFIKEVVACQHSVFQSL